MHGEGVARDRGVRRRAARARLPRPAVDRARAVRPRSDSPSASGCAELIEARLAATGVGRPCLTGRSASGSSAAATSPARTGQTAAAYPNVEIVGATDIDRVLSAAFVGAVRRHRLPVLEALLADPAIDAVVNLTSHGIHAEVTTAALEAGKHVHSEKPMAGSYAEARRLVELADAKGLRLSCSPITFLGDAQETAWSLIASGAIGNVRVVYAEVNWGRIETWHPRPAPFYAIGPMADVGVYPLTYPDGHVRAGPPRDGARPDRLPRPPDDLGRAVHGRRARLRRCPDRARGRNARAADDELLRRPAEQAEGDRVPRRRRARCSCRAGRTSTPRSSSRPSAAPTSPFPCRMPSTASTGAGRSTSSPMRSPRSARTAPPGAHAAHVVEILDAVETSRTGGHGRSR